MLENLLIYRMIILNVVCGGVAVWAYQMGFVADMFMNDASYMTYVASALFAVGLLSCFSRARKTSEAHDLLKHGLHPSVNGAKFLEKNAHLDDIGDLIVTVGLTGTAIGVVMMLHSFSAGSLTDPTKIAETAASLSEGVGTAFRSTIVSSILWMWFRVNLRMLKTATVTMIEDAKS